MAISTLFSRNNAQQCCTKSPVRTCFVAAGLLLVSAAPLAAQDARAEAEDVSGDYLDSLKTCQAILDNSQRLACFDQAVGAMVTASDAGDVQVVDREDVRQTRRSLFGFNLPDLGIFGGSEEDAQEEELFTTTITRVRYESARKARITTEEGAVWEMKNIPPRLRQIEPGDEVEFKTAALGYYFLRIDGQMGVKGRRVQ